jgi:hypothetical protein
VVALFGVTELLIASYYGISHWRGRSTSVATATTTAPVATPAQFVPAATAAPTAATSTAAETPPPAVTAPSAPAAPYLAPDERLVQEGVELSNRGDNTTALNRLLLAAQANPQNAQAYAEMARIYESTNNLDRSNEMWRKVHDLGAATAGPLYEMADARLKRGVAATPAPAVTEATPEQAPPAPAPAAAQPGADGIPDGSTFGISEITTSETPDPDADTNMLLKIGVKKRPNAVIDHTKVKIQVFFYDTVNDSDIKLTDAEVNYEWLTPDHDWAGAKPEVLAVTYVRPKNKARSQEAALSDAAASINPNRKARTAKPAAPADDSTRRKYLGYIVRIYYNDRLQAVRADPTKLLNLFPPPTTASTP